MPTLANNIRNQMFTFEDLIGVPETAMRDLLAAIDKKTLALALKGATEPVKDIFSRSCRPVPSRC